MEGGISKDAVVALVGTFMGGFIMTWFRGYNWFNEGVTYIVALLGGAVVTLLLGASTGIEWMIGVMQYSLMILGGIHVGGGAAAARAATPLPAIVLPKFNELSK